MPGGVASDANNGSISWSLSYFTGLQPMPVWGFPGQVWGGNTNQAIGVQLPGAANAQQTAAYFTTMRTLCATWKNANVWYDRIILDFSVTSAWDEFSPWLTAGSGNPGGDTWSDKGTVVNNVLVSGRTTTAQFSKFNAFCVGTQPYANTPINFGGV
jgi:hypothetical protein